jgi:hypothetical protein
MRPSSVGTVAFAHAFLFPSLCRENDGWGRRVRAAGEGTGRAGRGQREGCVAMRCDAHGAFADRWFAREVVRSKVHRGFTTSDVNDVR